VILWSEKFKQNIMLWANTKVLSHFIHIFENVNAENFSMPSVRLNQTSKH